MNWIPLTDYSTKHKVSVSTLRRRIKGGTIEYRFESGKYYVLDEPIQTHHTLHRPSQLRAEEYSAPQPSPSRDSSEEQARDAEESQPMEEPVFTTAQTLLAEIKQAYRAILQEKEEQIMQLKDQLNDLRTLVKVLEGENDRLNGIKIGNKMSI